MISAPTPVEKTQNSIQFFPIAYIKNSFHTVEGMPVQPSGAQKEQARIEVLPEFTPGLKDLEGFSHIIILTFLDKIQGYDLEITPFLDDEPHGVFATRSPKRPNPIGFSVLRLDRIQDNILEVFGADLLNNTPILDIKPYIPDFDIFPANKIGWFEGKSQKAEHHKGDSRFI